MQIGWDGGLVLIDPLAVDVAPLAEVLESDALTVMHAAEQDLEVLDLACGTVPRRLFDTQVAAGFVGLATPSLVALVEKVVGVRLPKASRLTDWLKRPLTDEQATYAASDVIHLLEVHDELCRLLEGAGRLEWVEDECELLRTRGRHRTDPADAWLRIKDARSLRGRSAAVAREVAAWRERRAAEIDIPVRHVLPDMGIVTIAQRQPATREQLLALRGVDGRHLKGGASDELLAAVRAGKEADLDTLPPAPNPQLDRRLRPAATLVSAWLSQLGRDLRIDPTLLGTRADIQDLLSRSDDARLAQGWRKLVVGDAVSHLVDGDAALAFDGNGGLVLEERSGKRYGTEVPVPDAEWL